MATFAIGPQGGQALGSPDYKIYRYNKTYSSDDFSAGPVSINRVTGPQRVSMFYNDGVNQVTSWSFSINGGTNQEVTNCLPMFPNPSQTYNQNINYTLDGEEISPLGCNVQLLPIPDDKRISRINRFSITESVTGNDFVFNMELCPFLNIATLFESIGPVLPPDSNVSIIIEFYRVTPNLRTNGVPISMMSPSYRTIQYIADILPEGGSSPLDTPTTQVVFARFRGQQTIVFNNPGIDFFFAIDVDYGIIGQGNSYIGYVDPTSNCKLVSSPMNCTVQNISTSPGAKYAVNKVVKLQVTTGTNDGGGRVYVLTFSPYTYNNIPPTISMTSGSAIGDNEVSISVYGRYFRTV